MAPSGQTGIDLANFATQFVGNPYVYGGSSLTDGADCSGFVMAVYAQLDIHFHTQREHSHSMEQE
nr:NlpC/P60 family protein [Coprococcus sp. OM06-25]